MEKHVLTVLVDEPNNQVEITVDGQINILATAADLIRQKSIQEENSGNEDEELIIADENGIVKEVFGRPKID